MKTNSLAIITLTTGLIIYSGSLFSQKTIKVKKHLESLPKIELKEKTPQKYLMVTDGWEYDIYGNFSKKDRVTGQYTRGLQNNHVKWNNVRIAHSQKLNESFIEGDKQNFMENFSYVASKEVLNESFFKDVPYADVQMKALVWNMVMFELFAWNYWDSLKLNRDFAPVEINSVFQIEGLGTAENKDIRITWTGITEKNSKLCAIIQYIAMNNPMNFKLQNTEILGRNHFWGKIYGSLSDKQIEYGQLYQDVVMEIKMDGQETCNIGNAVRNITLEKIH